MCTRVYQVGGQVGGKYIHKMTKRRERNMHALKIIINEVWLNSSGSSTVFFETVIEYTKAGRNM